jgi:Transposase, Mutator family
MAHEKLTLLERLRKGEEPAGDFLREAVRWLLQELMEAEVGAQIGAERYERSPERTAQRNGYRPRPWDKRLGTLTLEQGAYLQERLARFQKMYLAAIKALAQLRRVTVTVARVVAPGDQGDQGEGGPAARGRTGGGLILPRPGETRCG